MKKCVLILSSLLILTAVSGFAQKITGLVRSAQDSAPLPGVSILVKGTNTGTSSDSDGAFSLDADANATLVISFIGFATQEVELAGRTNIEVSLAEDIAQLGEIVVTAFGIQREQKSLGYATATVGGKSLTQTASPNFASALYGKAPGVRIATTPGGATSAVNISIRGINTITGKSQPLIVLNGVPIRDGEVNNGDYWNDQRIRGNGLLDLNPEDIESISILKGSSAAALYGSEAVNGVVLVTTKSGKGTKGFNVNFSTSYTIDKIAYTPRYQNVRGPGAPLNINNAGQDEAGFIYQDLNGDGVNETRGVLGFSINFGPKFDGQPTLAWDGKIRPYLAQKNNYGGFFQTAHNKISTIAVSHGGENASTRLSFTRQDNEGISIGAKNEKNIANLNTNIKLGKKYTVDVVVNYINQQTKNRPYSIDRMQNNFTGMIGRFDHADWYLDKYKTSKGYRFVTGGDPSLTPDENIIYPGSKPDILDYVWRVKENKSDELSNRVISSVTNTWQITDELNLRGRFGMDLTSMRTEFRNRTEKPLAFGYTGAFGMENYSNTLAYGDVMLSYTKSLTPDLKLGVMAGYTATKELNSIVSRSTNGGLSTENLFDVAATVNTANSSSSRYALVKDAIIGTINGNYKEFLFLEFTGRRDRTSTMNPTQNSFFYPSVNSSFVFSEAFSVPNFLSFGKIRASWGIVGNYPDRYNANIAYSQNTLGNQVEGGQPVLYTTVANTFGNDAITPEEKHEIEFGIDTRFFQNRIGLDLTYYNGQIRDQILPLTLPTSAGANSVLTNIGTLRNTGIEIALTGSPIKSTNGLTWDVTLNAAKNTNKVEKLTTGSNELLHADYDGNAAQLKSLVGRPMGDIYVHPVARHANGGMIVDPNGLYKVDADTMVRAGNYMPKLVGGLINEIKYKGFTLNAVIDYRIGGHVMPTALNWMISRGLLEESTKFMDEEHGGKPYLQDADGNRTLVTGSGPVGETVYHDGMILPGVKADGTPNDYVASATEYYWVVYNWGGPQYSPNTRYELFVKENSYVKMREISLSYSLPQSISSKIKARNIEFSVYGRNLFFLYRTIKDMDPEQTTAGSRWYQNVNNLGTNPSARSYGASLRINF